MLHVFYNTLYSFSMLMSMEKKKKIINRREQKILEKEEATTFNKSQKETYYLTSLNKSPTRFSFISH